jgi:Ca2+-binding RTX toxin-like protein
MATVTAGAGPLDMTNIQIVNNLQSAMDSIYNANLVRVDAGGGNYDDVSGQGFSFGGGGYYGMGGYDPLGGTVTGVTEVLGNTTTMTVTGLSLDAVSFFGDFRNHNVQGVINDLLSGDDQITGSTGADTLDGWGGNDTILAGDGADVVRGLDGNDSIDGGLGNDDVNGNKGDDVVHGGDGADIVRGGQGNDTVLGDAGDDPHVNGNIGDDIVHGGDGNDTVFGGQGNDTVFGDAGNDRISGDLGDDSLVGGAGADTFVFRPGFGHDIIGDFNAGEGDRIALPAGTAYSVVVDVGGNAVMDLGNGDTLTLLGITSSNFNSGWVVFE